MDCRVRSANKLVGVGIARFGPHLDAQTCFTCFAVVSSSRPFRRGHICVSRRRTHLTYRNAARRNVGGCSFRARCRGGGGLRQRESRFGGGEGKNDQALRLERL